MSTLAARRCILIAGLVAALLPAARAADTPAGDDKASASLRARVASGETVRVLLELDQAAVVAREQTDLLNRRLQVPDADLIAGRARAFAGLKAPLADWLSRRGVHVVRDYSHLPTLALDISGAADLEALLARPDVVSVAEDIRLYPVGDAGLALIGQPQVANVVGDTGAGTTITVVDTGVDYTNAAFGPCTAPGVPAACRVVYAADLAPNDGQLDSIGHGSEVAGVVTMVAPAAQIAALDVFDTTGSASSTAIIDGINWAIANRAAYNIVAINMSLGDSSSNTAPCSSKTTNPFRQPIINARSAGILSVVASGNDANKTGISMPACTPEAISVGATYNASYASVGYGTCSDSPATVDTIACFSNSANYLTLLAPGSLISVLGKSAAGTSFSAPYVSGALAVLAGAFPADTVTALQTRLTSTGKPITDPRNGFVVPRIDLLAAVGAPSNDAFSAARSLSGTSGNATGWNYNATAETGEPLHAGIVGGRSVWWQWTAPATGTLALDTNGSDFDTLLGLYSGTAVSALTAIASNDNATGKTSSALSAHVVQGTTYHIAVDGKAGASGAVTLDWALTPDTADLSVSLAAAPAAPVLGQALTYTLGVSNAGPISASGVTVTLSLPPSGVTLISVASSCSASANVVTCTAGTLAAGASASYAVVVIPTMTGALSASATASDSGPTDPVSANNTVTVSESVAGSGVGGGGANGDVPLPLWALALLGCGIARGVLRRR